MDLFYRNKNVSSRVMQTVDEILGRCSDLAYVKTYDEEFHKDTRAEVEKAHEDIYKFFQTKTEDYTAFVNSLNKIFETFFYERDMFRCMGLELEDSNNEKEMARILIKVERHHPGEMKRLKKIMSSETDVLCDYIDKYFGNKLVFIPEGVN